MEENVEMSLPYYSYLTGGIKTALKIADFTPAFIVICKLS